ncbi:arylsulfatase B [Scaptodrosophila lebanonensis]|uniref:Arylsulfatase B n=1 Tax=Drosophila lebanonensis TaxID=7225 RepID=A0A6J2TAS4_DROLE|nr:arylsulfatase B [Scaptodrosophila lebanonensis]
MSCHKRLSTETNNNKNNSNNNRVNNKKAWLILLLSTALAVANGQAEANGKPHIIIIMADDMGFDDVSFRGSNHFLTPNIDALAYSGVILNNLYTPAMCTPSRAALLTGKYPINTGMQHYVIVNDQPWGLPLNETTMAQIFKQNGYYTSLLGKWHLGMSRRNFTPTERGFDHHFGYLGAYVDYYDQTLMQNGKNYSRGHDFRSNLQVSHEHVGEYLTDVLTEAAVQLIDQHNATAKPLFLLLSHLAPHAANDDQPMQAPAEELAQFAYIKDETRRYYAAMVSRLDKSVGRVIDALARRQLLQQSIVLFLSDNGGPTEGMHATKASNYPLRGQKNSPWEGGIRSSAAIWSTEFEKLGSVWRQPFYIGDLLPTLAEAAGISLPPTLKVDGLNLWSALKYGYESVEREILHNIDETDAYFAYTKGKWKVVNGTTVEGAYDGWLGSRHATEIDPRAASYEQVIRNTSVWQHLQEVNRGAERNITALRQQAQLGCSELPGTPCLPLKAPCLFDIDVDPCELNNLYEDHRNASFFLDMWDRIEQFAKQAHPPANKPADPKCDPRYYKNEWTWWEDEQQAGDVGVGTGTASKCLCVNNLPFILFIFLATLTGLWL